MYICHDVLFHPHIAASIVSLFPTTYTRRLEEVLIVTKFKCVHLHLFQNLKKYLDRTYPDHFFRCTTEVISSEDHGESVLLELPLKEAEQLGYSLRSDKEPCSVSCMRPMA